MADPVRFQIESTVVVRCLFAVVCDRYNDGFCDDPCPFAGVETLVCDREFDAIIAAMQSVHASWRRSLNAGVPRWLTHRTT